MLEKLLQNVENQAYAVRVTTSESAKNTPDDHTQLIIREEELDWLKIMPDDDRTITSAKRKNMKR